MSDEDEVRASRRDVLRGGAIGMGALVGAMGVSGAADASAPAVRMAAASTSGQRFFLEVDSISGPATAKGFEHQIPVHSFSWGIANSSSGSPGGGGGAGKVTATPLALTMTSSIASPPLALACATGKHIASATLRGVRKDGKGKSSQYLTIKLTNVIVSSLHQSESSGGAPLDTVQLSFAKVVYTESGHTVTLSPNQVVT
jgi:type VI secretion system secreted protein Hcp